MNITNRGTHRDTAYFFLGLIISFSISGIFLNHRQSWHPRRYTYSTRDITVPAPIVKDSVNETYVKKIASDNGIADEMRRFQVNEKQLRISFVSHDVEIDVNTGSGKVTQYKVTPLLGQMTQLHQDTSKWWIYYSDAFGLGMLTLAITGMFIDRGPKGFTNRGWKLALLGIVFPLIFLFLLS